MGSDSLMGIEFSLGMLNGFGMRLEVVVTQGHECTKYH